MAIQIYIAMSAAELAGAGPLPWPAAWMACHFSPHSRGLSNCPERLPPGSLLILDDSIPMDGHDPELIARQLRELIRRFGCGGLVLDLQRPGCREAEALAAYLCGSLGCPVTVSAAYAGTVSAPVLVPPVPLHRSPAAHLEPWLGREIWLELETAGAQLRLTSQGAVLRDWICDEETLYRHRRLHCGYRIRVVKGEAVFRLRRSREDNLELLEECHALGVTGAIGRPDELLG